MKADVLSSRTELEFCRRSNGNRLHHLGHTLRAGRDTRRAPNAARLAPYLAHTSGPKTETFALDFSCKGSMCGGDGQTD